MSNAVLTNPSVFLPLLTTPAPFTSFSICGSPLFSPAFTTPPSAPNSLLLFPLSHPLSLYPYFLHPPFVARCPHISSFLSLLVLLQPCFSSICPFSSSASLHPPLPFTLCVLLSLWRHHMCSAGKCVSVCVCTKGCVSHGIPSNARHLDINRNDAWKDRAHECIGGTSQKTSSHP